MFFLWLLEAVVVPKTIFEAVLNCCNACRLFDVDILGHKKSEQLD